jgi:hypothetical protein
MDIQMANNKIQIAVNQEKILSRFHVHRVVCYSKERHVF